MFPISKGDAVCCFETVLSHFEKDQPEIKVHLEIRSFLAMFCFIFNRFLKNLFLSVPLLIL